MRVTVGRLALAGVAGLALLGTLAAPATAAAPARPSAPPAITATDPAAALVSASATFFTSDDDKDDNTGLSIQVLSPAGAVAALACCNFGQFPDNSTNGPIPLQVNGGFTAGSLNNGQVRLAITPVGDDSWRFSYRVNLGFSDGTTVPVIENGLELTESSRVHFTPMTTVGLVAVPDLTGDTPAGASAELQAVGLVLGSQSSRVDPSCNNINRVMDQSPNPNVLVSTGTAVSIVIGRKPRICP